jgi:ketosteroid isomerase-like protein
MAQTGPTQLQELDQAWIEGFAKRWEAAWNSHEHGRLLELMTDDIVYDDSAWPTTMRG